MSLTAGAAGRCDSQDSMPPPTGARCATVTMMLADRIARSEWSVDDELFFEANTMNVWQTLEYLSGVSLRKRYNYEGYADPHNVLRTLTPSWRRDATEHANPNDAMRGGGAGGAASGSGSGSGGVGGSTVRAASGITRGCSVNVQRPSPPVTHGNDPFAEQFEFPDMKGPQPSGQRRRRGRRKKGNVPDLDPEYALSPSDLQDLVKCTFNLPRISARLERLMGTNVVKLTDRVYMKELRERIDEDYRKQLLQRIKAREMKEVERERLLIIEGKSDVIPDELADDPIFMVNKDANTEIQKERSKLKTNREKNAERLKQQGVKWERERLQHAAKEAELLQKKKERQRQQKMLVELYKTEDAERGMDLLRIDNEDWRECEQSLKEFLQHERAKMKERSMRVPTPFSTDQRDIQNIVRARQKFRETEMRIRQQLEESEKDKDIKTMQTYNMQAFAAMLSTDSVQDDFERENSNVFETDSFQERMRRRFLDDATDVSDESLITEEISSLSVAKQRYAAELEEEMENEVNRGLLISKMQYDQLRFEDEKILALRNAKDIRELYQLAEEIIMGEILEEEVFDFEGEEEGEEEVQPEQQSEDQLPPTA